MQTDGDSAALNGGVMALARFPSIFASTPPGFASPTTLSFSGKSHRAAGEWSEWNEALVPLVRLYEAWEKPAKADEWRKKLAAFERPDAGPK